MISTFRMSALTLFALALGACATQGTNTTDSATAATPSVVAPAAPAAVNLAASENASHVAEIRFKENSADLSEEARQTLVSTMNEAQKAGVVSDVKVLAWADKDYPSKRTKKLSKGERDLAGERGENVRKFVKTLFTLKDVDTYNMAKRPNAVQRLFHTDDARVKRAMESAGIPNSDSLNEARVSKASRAVVMVITK